MSTEYGLFNDEGLVEGDFRSEEDAAKAIAERYTEEDELHVGEICPEHPDHERHTCEECNSEDDDVAEGSTDFDPGPTYPIKY